MSQTASRLSVVSAALPNVDRRALSQAWYSTLHMASPQSASVRAHSVSLANVNVNERPPAYVETATLRGTGSNARPALPGQSLRAPAPAPSERRCAPAPLARKVVRAVERRAPARFPASVALRTESGRVHLVVRREGHTLRFIALCTPSLRERVERALAQARYALAARGFELC